MGFEGVKALTFDVFGTVVDWRTSIIEEGEVWGRERIGGGLGGVCGCVEGRVWTGDEEGE